MGKSGCLPTAQCRYDEAKVALKQSLVIDPDYPIARDNLKRLPAIRRSKRPVEVRTINLAQGDDVKQSLALFDKDKEGEVTSTTFIEKVGRAVTSTWKPTGKQSPRYDFFLNIFPETRFVTCPQCEVKTRVRKLPLVINVKPNIPVVLYKICRYCDTCDLLIVHRDQLEEQLLRNLMVTNPEAIDNDYLVIGTIDITVWNRMKRQVSSFRQIADYLHDFKEVVTFSREPLDE